MDIWKGKLKAPIKNVVISELPEDTDFECGNGGVIAVRAKHGPTVLIAPEYNARVNAMEVLS